MHWELEFADLFAERGGFDLIIGNPPWVKMEWKEQSVLSDKQPLFAVKDYSAAQTAKLREKELSNSSVRDLYFSEYENMTGVQAFLSANTNYYVVRGATNLYKCFLPQAWKYSTLHGVSAFIHPDGVYDDPKGSLLRAELYPRLRKHFQFINELKLFADVHHNTVFSLNVYSNDTNRRFDTISNLYSASTIDECYSAEHKGMVPGIKDETGWCVKGHPDRIISVGTQELKLFASVFEGSEEWNSAKLPVLHCKQLVDVLDCFLTQEVTIEDCGDDIFTTEMWNETGAQKDGTIMRDVHFPDDALSMIYSGPHLGVANPLFKTSRRICRLNSDYDNIDLISIDAGAGG